MGASWSFRSWDYHWKLDRGSSSALANGSIRVQNRRSLSRSLSCCPRIRGCNAFSIVPNHILTRCDNDGNNIFNSHFRTNDVWLHNFLEDCRPDFTIFLQQSYLDEINSASWSRSATRDEEYRGKDFHAQG